MKIPNYSVTIVYRKTKNARFNPCLDTSTSVGTISSGLQYSYTGGAGAASGLGASRMAFGSRRLIRGVLRRLRAWFR